MTSRTTDPEKNVRFAESLDARQQKYMPDQLQVAAGGRDRPLADIAPRTTGVMEEQFPTDGLTAYDPRDKVMSAKLQLQDVDKAPGYTQFGKLIAKDSDFEWYQRKQAAAEVAEFQRYFAEQYDMMDPAQKKRAKELYPEFYAERKRTLKRNAKNLAKLAQIKLEGPSDLDDVKLLYLAESGRLPLGPLQNILHPELSGMNRDEAGATFIRGLASPFLLWGKQAAPNDDAARKQRAKQYANVKYPADAQQEYKDVSDAQWFSLLSKGISQFGGPAGSQRQARQARDDLVPLDSE